MKIEMQVVEIYPYKTFKEKIRVYEKLIKLNSCRVEVFEGFFFIEKFELVHAEFDFKKHRSLKKRKRRRRHGKKKTRRNCGTSQ